MREENLHESGDLGRGFALGGEGFQQALLFGIRRCGIEQQCAGHLHFAGCKFPAFLKVVNQCVHGRKLSRARIWCQNGIATTPPTADIFRIRCLQAR